MENQRQLLKKNEISINLIVVEETKGKVKKERSLIDLKCFSKGSYLFFVH
jgi:hypothetical protein